MRVSSDSGFSEANPRWSLIGIELKRPSSIPPRDAGRECDSRAYRALALSLAGDLAAASHDFAAADTIERHYDPENASLCGGRGTDWCRHLMRLGYGKRVHRLTHANRHLCRKEGWNTPLAHCDLLLGELCMASQHADSAARWINDALLVYRAARQGLYLPDALLAQARLRGSIEDCEEALRLAARSGFALKQCDALNLRARLRRDAGQPADAAKDARDALEIAERCGYYWGRHEALRQLRDAAKAVGSRADEKHWDEAEQALAARMKPEIEEALRINREHDAEMERLYGGSKPQE